MAGPIKVLIVEDSRLMQEIFTRVLSSDPDITVVGVADDPLKARELIKSTNPDVLTLDIMLPVMDGITFLKNLIRLRPMPVVVISSLTDANSTIALDALAIGAIDYLAKPTSDELTDLRVFQESLIKMVKNASIAKVKSLTHQDVTKGSRNKNMQKVFYPEAFLKSEVIVIGASTGGIEAVESILFELPQVLPPIIIVQHTRKAFGSAFANRMKRIFGLNIMQAENYGQIIPGNIYIAPTGQQLLVAKRKNNFVTNLKEMEGYVHKPSVDALFLSTAEVYGENSTAILLTGMGTDGAVGMKAIHDAGGTTIAQDEQSSVVWGMPGAAVKLNAVDYVVPLDKVARKILSSIEIKSRKN